MTFIDQAQTRDIRTASTTDYDVNNDSGSKAIGALSTSGINKNSPKDGVIPFAEGSPPRSPHTFRGFGAIQDQQGPDNTDAATTEDLSRETADLPTSPASLHSSLSSPRGPSDGSTLYIDAQEHGLIDHSRAQLLHYFKTAIGQIWVCNVP